MQRKWEKAILLNYLENISWLRVSCFFILSFDESLNKYVQRGQMVISVKFMADNHVQPYYFNSVFLGRARAEDLFIGFSIWY